MNKEKYYDTIINIALTNLYTLSKEDNRIVLSGFDRKNKNHLCLIQIAKYAEMFGRDVYVKSSFIDRIVIKKKLGLKVKNFKEECNDIYMDDFITYIEKANEDTNIFEEIYMEYFERN